MDPATAFLVDAQRLFGFVEAALWTLLRVGAVLMAAPLIGTRAVPVRVRMMFAMALAVTLAPVLPAPPPVASVDALTVLNVIREIAVGVAMGFVLRLAFEAGALAGELVSQGMALSFAQMADPLRGGASSGVVGQWFYVALALLFFAFDAHLALVGLIADSYRLLPVGTPLADPARLAAAVPAFLPTVLYAGVMIALPVMVAMLVVNLSFGVLSRAAPALNPIQIGLPAALVIGLFLLTILTGELAGPAKQLFEAAFEHAGGMLR
ncbi:flagellar biosynthetic protein FliR [Rehaibacterium terrae]|jgi:flagellar biosynthetic protein FliR|uniref:Flagellar biosynthetic protein FliR n=1 Tax=Rehaibacterium terrae TaxID=1341696 RepID=A0A7W7Y251_9GAMM|nr:flagellar biosynthetic protein FliR [Rehaibacterium terrae]MBB5016716.1 flagellar biosynthetic protein FliR [Rehaibacterium terrae]